MHFFRAPDRLLQELERAVLEAWRDLCYRYVTVANDAQPGPLPTALLHDAVEDAGGKPRLEDIRVRFGDAVAEILDGCPDTDVKLYRAS